MIAPWQMGEARAHSIIRALRGWVWFLMIGLLLTMAFWSELRLLVDPASGPVTLTYANGETVQRGQRFNYRAQLRRYRVCPLRITWLWRNNETQDAYTLTDSIIVTSAPPADRHINRIYSARVPRIPVGMYGMKVHMVWTCGRAQQTVISNELMLRVVK